MITRRAVWHTLHLDDIVRPDGWRNTFRLSDVLTLLAPGEVVTVYEPELHDAVANLAAAGFELSIVEEK